MENYPDIILKLFENDMFQKCIITPYLYQFNQLYYNQKASIIVCSNQPIYIGVHISKPLEYQGTNEEFIDIVRKHIECIDFSYSIINSSNEILQETSLIFSHCFYSLSSYDQTINPNISMKKCEICSTGVLVYIKTILNISKQYYNIPLSLKIILNIPMKQIKRFNQKFVVDENEMNIRLLMDLNRLCIYHKYNIEDISIIIIYTIIIHYLN